MIKRISSKLLTILHGFAVGIANIIPGVSGGTLALILGIYERMIGAIGKFSFRSLKTMILALSFKRNRIDEFKKEMKKVDAVFLGLLLLGIALAFVSFSKLMTYLIESHHDITYGFFFGLILASIAVPFMAIRKKDYKTFISIAVGIAIVVLLALIESDEQKIQSAKTAQEITAASGSLYGDLDIGRIVMVLITGVLSTSAMILPGISGSFISLLLGQYFFLLYAISTGNILVLGVYLIGAIAGLKLFAKVMQFLFNRFHDVLTAFLTGLVIGSLYITWPFKTTYVVGDETLYLHNTVPGGFALNEYLTAAAALVGILIVLVMMLLGRRMDRHRREAEAEEKIA